MVYVVMVKVRSMKRKSRQKSIFGKKKQSIWYKEIVKSIIFVYVTSKVIYFSYEKLPRYRPCIITQVLEYYPIGHDEATSVLSG